jgi:hypothetical protein
MTCVLYASVSSSFMYVIHFTRLHISHSMGLLSMYVKTKEDHWTTVNMVSSICVALHTTEFLPRNTWHKKSVGNA